MFVKLTISLLLAAGYGISGLTFLANLDNFRSWALFLLSAAFLILRGYSYFLTVKKKKLKSKISFESYEISKRERTAMKNRVRSKSSMVRLANIEEELDDTVNRNKVVHHL
jgi:hypothetical protein